MTEQQKILRVFKLISLLSSKPYRTKAVLAENLGVDIRTTDRYFNLLEELGYEIDQEPHSKGWFLVMEALPAEQGVRFTVEESELMHELLNGYSEKNSLRQNIIRKLLINSDLHPLSENITAQNNALKIRRLVEAIQRKCCVILKNYHSTNSQTTKNRLVEPLTLDEQYESVTVFEPESGLQKVFRLDRMTEVEVLYEQKQLNKTVAAGKDFFGFMGETAIPVKLLLTDRAYRLLIEEYPATKPYARKEGKDKTHLYCFEASVKAFEGIGRFVLGLHSEVKVESPAALKKYLNGKLKGLKY